jgi:hypothetical protein
MGMMQQVVADIKRITSDANTGFAIPVTFDNGTTQVTVNAIHSKRNLGVDTESQYVESHQAHVSVHEQILNDAGMVTRDGIKCIMKDWKITFNDVATGLLSKYNIDRVFPDDTTGLIVCSLGRRD